MDNLTQVENSLRQIRQNFNSMVNQINQQLSNSERLIHILRDQQIYQGQSTYYRPQQPMSHYHGQQNLYNSTYNQPGNTENYYGQGMANRQDNQNNANPTSGLRENKPTMRQQRGVNRYGAEYSSGDDSDEKFSN